MAREKRASVHPFLAVFNQKENDTMPLLSDYFNCDKDPLSLVMYDGKHVGFFAVVDHIDDGVTFAADIPAQQCRGLDVFEGKPLPEFVVFLYPEHSLVPKQEQRFVHQLIERYPDVKRIIIITTASVRAELEDGG